jgi:hypothetical protein
MKEKKKSGLLTKSSTSLIKGLIDISGPFYHREDILVPPAECALEEAVEQIKETGRKYNKADHEKRRQLDREFEEGGWKNEIALAKRAIFDSTNLDQCLGIIMPFARVLRRGSYCERLIIERLILLSQEEKKLDQISKEFMVYSHPGMPELLEYQKIALKKN